MFYVVGREILYGSYWPWETTWYKAAPKSMLAMQEVRGAYSTAGIALETWREERSPTLVSGV